MAPPKKDECLNGHPRTPENVTTSRACRQCHNERGRIRDPCAYCGGPGGEADHVDPVSLGGGNDWMNLTGSCSRCNAKKRTKPLFTFLLEVA